MRVNAARQAAGSHVVVEAVRDLEDVRPALVGVRR